MVMLLGALLALLVFVLVVMCWLWVKLPKVLRNGLVAYGFPAVARTVRFLIRAPAQFGVTLVAETWGRACASALALVMLWDASWGEDGVGIPVVGSLGLFLAALVVGGFQVRRWDGWCRAVEEVLRENVPRYRQTEDRRPSTKYGGGGPLRIYTGEYTFRFAVPGGIQPAELVELEERMRTRLPALEDTSFGFDWRLKRSLCNVAAVQNIPTSITLAAAMSGLQASAAGYAPNWMTPLSSDPLLIPLGVALGPAGLVEIVWDPRNFYGSILIAGAPGGGKSCLLRLLAAHFLMYGDDRPGHDARSRRDDRPGRDSWRIRAVDMKRVELSYMRKYAPVVEDVAVDLPHAARVFAESRAEQKRRYKLFERAGVTNIHEYNDLMDGRGQPRLPHVANMCDEVAELLIPGKGKSEEVAEENALKDEIRPNMMSLSQLGRAAGMHLVLSTQRPTVDIVDGLIKSNVQARVAMGGLDTTGSQVAIESPLAAQLPGISGRGVWYLSGRLQQFQAYYASVSDLDAIHAARARGGVDLAA